MRRVLIVFFLFCPGFVFCQAGSTTVVLTNDITYRVDVSDFKEYKLFGEKLFDLLTDSNKLTNYQCYEWNPFEYAFTAYPKVKLKPLSNWQISRRIYYGKDYPSINEDGGVTNGLIDRFNYKSDTTQLFRFSEKWIYDTVNLKFYKRVDFIRPTVKFFLDSELKGTRAPYSVMLKQSSIIDTFLYLPNVQYDVLINNSLDPNGNWEPDNNIEPTERITFLKFILYNIFDGKIKAYKDSAKTQLITQVEDILNIKYTDELRKIEKEYLDKRYPNEMFDGYDTHREFYYRGTIEAINKIRFIEDWIFDDTHQCFLKKVKAMGFMAYDQEFVRDDEKEVIRVLGKEYEKYFVNNPRKKPLFWIFFK